MSVPCSPEGPAHPNKECMFCLGSATTVQFTPTGGVMSANGNYICADRQMCNTIRALEMLIAQTRSA